MTYKKNRFLDLNPYENQVKKNIILDIASSKLHTKAEVQEAYDYYRVHNSELAPLFLDEKKMGECYATETNKLLCLLTMENKECLEILKKRAHSSLEWLELIQQTTDVNRKHFFVMHHNLSVHPDDLKNIWTKSNDKDILNFVFSKKIDVSQIFDGFNLSVENKYETSLKFYIEKFHEFKQDEFKDIFFEKIQKIITKRFLFNLIAIKDMSIVEDLFSILNQEEQDYLLKISGLNNNMKMCQYVLEHQKNFNLDNMMDTLQWAALKEHFDIVDYITHFSGFQWEKQPVQQLGIYINWLYKKTGQSAYFFEKVKEIPETQRIKMFELFKQKHKTNEFLIVLEETLNKIVLSQEIEHVNLHEKKECKKYHKI